MDPGFHFVGCLNTPFPVVKYDNRLVLIQCVQPGSQSLKHSTSGVSPSCVNVRLVSPFFSERSKISFVLTHSFLSEYQGILQSVTSQTILLLGITSATVKSKKESPPIFITNLSLGFSVLPLKLTPHHPGML